MSIHRQQLGTCRRVVRPWVVRWYPRTMQTSAQPHHWSQGTVDIGMGLGVDQQLEIHIVDDLPTRVDTYIRAQYEADTGRYLAKDVRVEAVAPGHEITGTLLRDIRLREYIRSALEETPLREWHGEWVGVLPIRKKLTPALIESLTRKGPKPETLEWVAKIYRISEVCSLPPNKAVVDVFSGVDPRTVGRWIAKAKQLPDFYKTKAVVEHGAGLDH